MIIFIGLLFSPIAPLSIHVTNNYSCPLVCAFPSNSFAEHFRQVLIISRRIRQLF